MSKTAQFWAPAQTGAFVAAGIPIVTFSGIVFLGLIASPLQVAVLIPMIAIGVIPWIVAFAVVGAIIGKLAGYFSNAFLSTLIGVTAALLIVWLGGVLTQEQREWPYEFADMLLPIGTFGAITGISVNIVMRPRPSSLRERVPIYSVLSVCAIATIALVLNEMRSSNRSAQIEKAGGSMSFSRLEDPRGRMVVSFRGTEMHDFDLQAILPVLHSFPRLELDLGHTNITDVGISSLSEFSSLVKLQVDKTAVTDSQVSALRSALPKVEVLQSGPNARVE